MKTESFVRIIAGTVVVLSAALAAIHSPYWLLLNGFVGLNLIQSAFTGFCPPTLVLEKLGWVRDDGTIAWGGR